MNISNDSKIEQLSEILHEISQPVRLKILLQIGSGEACVCHLGATLKLRQAYLSQHLMAMRSAGILTTRRDGRFIYYHLANPLLLEIIHSAAKISKVEVDAIRTITSPSQCTCPKCSSHQTKL